MNSSKYALVLAIVLGVLAAFGVHKHMSDSERKATDKVKPDKVLFAAQNIQEGQEIVLEFVETKDWPHDYVFDQLYYEGEKAGLIGKIASSSISAGTPFLKRLVEPKQGPAPAEGIPINRRAFTLPVDAITGVAGMIKPMDGVDVIAHLKDADAQGARKGGGQSTTTITMLENIPVLAVGPQAGRRWGGRRDAQAEISSVTLSVTPEQATLLLHVLKEGSISLALRRKGETTSTVPPVVDSQNLLRTIERLRGAGGK